MARIDRLTHSAPETGTSPPDIRLMVRTEWRQQSRMGTQSAVGNLRLDQTRQVIVELTGVQTDTEVEFVGVLGPGSCGCQLAQPKWFC